VSDIEDIVDSLRSRLDEKNNARDAALARSRNLIRLCASSIRATHRGEFEKAQTLLGEADTIAHDTLQSLAPHPDLYYAGYTQDSFKEYAEAHITYAIVRGMPIPPPGRLNTEPAAYLNGLAEAMGEIRRHVLDLIREDKLERAEELLFIMDEVYWQLITVDFPSVITGGLRRSTDMLRGTLERTRADLTTAQGQARLRQSLRQHQDFCNER